MKKYIISLVALSCNIFNANAMELSLKPSDSETEKEFIERTRKQPELTPECTKFFDNYNMQCERYSFSPHETKLLAVAQENDTNYWLPFRLMVIDLYKKNGNIRPNVVFDKPLTFALNLPEYDRIALASQNNMIATFYKNIWWENDGGHSESVFKIKKIDVATGNVIDEQKIEFPYHFYPTMIAFNKQGTLLIARDENEYHLFEVK